MTKLKRSRAETSRATFNARTEHSPLLMPKLENVNLRLVCGLIAAKFETVYSKKMAKAST